MNYAPVLPNLECAKLAAYYKKKKDIVVLTSEIDPSRYTRFIVRKDYDDGVYNKKIFSQNVDYGGLAFTKNIYSPLPLDIETTLPDFTIYERYSENFGTTKEAKQTFTKLMRGAHLRLSLDNKNIWEDFRKPVSLAQNTDSIFLHDFDLGKIPNSIDAINELAERYTVLKGIFRPRLIGMKFPVQINDSKSFYDWFNISPSFSLFFLQYNGVMEDSALFDLCQQNPSIAKQLHYNIGLARFSENDFLINHLPRIFKQVLFLRSQNIKILLKYEEDFFVDQRIKNLIRLFNNYLGRKKLNEDSILYTGTLYKFVSSKKLKKYQFAQQVMKLPEIRECFQYIREKNYEVFEMFYKYEKVEYKGGEFYV